MADPATATVAATVFKAAFKKVLGGLTAAGTHRTPEESLSQAEERARLLEKKRYEIESHKAPGQSTAIANIDRQQQRTAKDIAFLKDKIATLAGVQIGSPIVTPPPIVPPLLPPSPPASVVTGQPLPADWGIPPSIGVPRQPGWDLPPSLRPQAPSAAALKALGRFGIRRVLPMVIGLEIGTIIYTKLHAVDLLAAARAVLAVPAPKPAAPTTTTRGRRRANVASSPRSRRRPVPGTATAVKPRSVARPRVVTKIESRPIAREVTIAQKPFTPNPIPANAGLQTSAADLQKLADQAASVVAKNVRLTPTQSGAVPYFGQLLTAQLANAIAIATSGKVSNVGRITNPLTSPVISGQTETEAIINSAAQTEARTATQTDECRLVCRKSGTQKSRKKKGNKICAEKQTITKFINSEVKRRTSQSKGKS